MKGLMRRVKSRLAALHRDEQGADMIEYILVVAAIALPLLAVVIWFWKDISKWAGDLWEEAKANPPDDTSATLGEFLLSGSHRFSNRAGTRYARITSIQNVLDNCSDAGDMHVNKSSASTAAAVKVCNNRFMMTLALVRFFLFVFLPLALTLPL